MPRTAHILNDEATQREAIRESYSKAVDLKRKRQENRSYKEQQEISSLKQEAGPEDADTSQESTAESEDEDGDELSLAADVALLKTLVRIQNKDPSIYDNSKPIFDEEEYRASKASIAVQKVKKATQSKSLTYKQQAAKALLGDEDDIQVPTHAEEQAALQSETISAFLGAIDSEDEDDSCGLLVPRKEIKDDDEIEDDAYREFVQQEVGDVRKLIWVDEEARDAVKPDDEGIGGSSAKKPDAEAEEFLANYLLNRGWIDREARRIPTHDSVVSKGKGRQTDFESDDDFDELEEDFEATYNFRFEEPDGSKIPRHPRTIETLARRTESKRKGARERREERKQEEIKKKKEEVRREKNVKIKSLKEKLSIISKEGGLNVDSAKSTLEALDLEGDFDAEAFDRQMAAIYQNEANFADVDEDKPEWDDAEDLWDPSPATAQYEDLHLDDIRVPTQTDPKEPRKKKRNKKEKEKVAKDASLLGPKSGPGAEVVRREDEEEWDGTEEMRKRVLNDYMDEMYKMDFNDIVAGTPTRFSYAPVSKNNFSLTSTEILLATDKELNSYVGIKSLAPHKRKVGWDRDRGKKLGELKRTLAGRRWGYVGKQTLPMMSTSKTPARQSTHQKADKPRKVPSKETESDAQLPKRKRRKGTETVE